MARDKILKENGEQIFPVTFKDLVLDPVTKHPVIGDKLTIETDGTVKKDGVDVNPKTILDNVLDEHGNGAFNYVYAPSLYNYGSDAVGGLILTTGGRKTTSLIDASKLLRVIISGDLEARLYLFDSDSSFISSSGYQKSFSKSDFNGATYVRFLLKKTDDSIISDEDVENNPLMISMSIPRYENTKPVELPLYEYTIDAIYGYINPSDGSWVASTGKKYATTKGFLSTSNIDTVFIKNGYDMQLFGYESEDESSYIDSIIGKNFEFFKTDFENYPFIRIRIMKEGTLVFDEEELEDIIIISGYSVSEPVPEPEIEPDIPYKYNPFLGYGDFRIENGTYRDSPSKAYTASLEFIDTSLIDNISLKNGYKMIIFGYALKESSSFISANLNYRQQYLSSELNQYPYVRIRVTNDNKTEIPLSELGSIATISTTILEKDYLHGKKTEIIEIERGSLSGNGGFSTYKDDWEWKEDEFFNNYRSVKYMNVDASKNELISLNIIELEDYEVTLYEFDGSFMHINSSFVESNKFSLKSKTRYIKFHIKRVDGERIYFKPTLKVTALIDSENIYSYNYTEYGVTETILIEVATTNGRDQLEDFTYNSDLDEYSQIEEEPQFTNMILRVPKTYSPNGNPTRVIFYAHSSSYADATDFNPIYLPYIEYLIDEGYMVIDIFAWTQKYKGALQYMGSPNNIACVNAMYKFVSDNYNIKRDGVFVVGKSHGGYQVFSAEYMYSFKTLAGAALAGALTQVSYNYGYHDTDRIPTFRDFGVNEDLTPILQSTGANYSTDAVDLMRRNAKLLNGYIPLTMGAINLTDEEQFPYGNYMDAFSNLDYTVISRVPIKEWIAMDDPSCPIAYSFARKRAVEKGGGIFEIRLKGSGSADPHHTVDTIDVTVPVVKTITGVTHEHVPMSYVEVVQWFRKWEI